MNINKNWRLIFYIYFISTFVSIKHEGTETKVNFFFCKRAVKLGWIHYNEVKFLVAIYRFMTIKRNDMDIYISSKSKTLSTLSTSIKGLPKYATWFSMGLRGWERMPTECEQDKADGKKTQYHKCTDSHKETEQWFFIRCR